MNVAARSARRALYRDFYDLIPLFSSYSSSLVPRRTTRCSSATIKRSISSTPRRRLQVDSQTQDVSQLPPNLTTSVHVRQLPPACPGCGALTQSVHPEDAGHYSSDRAAVKRYLNWCSEPAASQPTGEDDIVKKTLENISPELRAQLGLDSSPLIKRDDEPSIPICDRCHHLVHHHAGIPINHPSLDAIEATIAESPHKYNHVYHVIDAADFPMSFMPALIHRLDFAWIRGRNRRAKTQHWSGGKSGQISFLITRSDLLAPRKEQVDQLMPQLREILRDAIGKTGKDVRLGNVHLLSSKRGWWTRQIKADIWERGGANWLVGKANVGKSNVFEVLYPKGTNEAKPNFEGAREDARRASVQALLANAQQPLIDGDEIGMATFQPPGIEEAQEEPEQHFLNTSSLLPPAQQAVDYPVMPIISSLPGTTASPIRIPFGSGKGELIDLPGMERRTLEPYVRSENQLDIVMKRRIAPERIVIKPGSSLVLGGGLIRITPKTPDLIFMAHAFVPMDTHLTSTEKAIQLQNGERDFQIPSIVNEEKKGSAKQAGTFRLKSNVTKKFAGPLTRKDDAGLSTARLPFVVWATDILIEGCGWVEIVAQVRKPRQQAQWHGDEAFESSSQQDAAARSGEGSTGDTTWSPVGSPAELSPSPQANKTAWIPANLPVDDAAPLASRSKRNSKEEGTHPLDLSPEALAKTMPEIEVFSPDGKFIAQRPSLSCWLLGGPLDKKTAGRPRKSMKGAKKLEKKRRREAGSAAE